MMPIWKNPEFVRHFRAELRPTRAVTIAAVVVVVAFLIWLGCWGSRASEMALLHRYYENGAHISAQRLAEMDRDTPRVVWLNFYRIMMYAQLGILTFWSLFSCAQSVSGERERKTWDFQRATRLTAAELLTGKLFGEPILAHFIVVCCLPIAVLAGLIARTRPIGILEAYGLIISGAIFLGITGLWLSSLLESKSRGVGLIGTFALYLGCALTLNFRNSSFPGVAALSPLTGFIPLFGEDPGFGTPTIFGVSVPWIAASLLIYSTLGSWLVLTLKRNLTKDYDQMRPLSRWQAVGCAAFLNFMSCAFYSPSSRLKWDSFIRLIVAENAFILFAMGLAMLTSSERLRVWWRNRAAMPNAFFSNDGPQWPWLLLSAVVGYGLLVSGLLVWKNFLGFESLTLKFGLVEFAVIAIFVTRDVTFIQWCRLTRMRAPVSKGILFVGLYYATAIVIALVCGVYSNGQRESLFSLLTPLGVFDATAFHPFGPAVFVGMAIQLAVTALLERAIMVRLRHAAGDIAPVQS